MAYLTPRAIVTELDRYIVGQNEAKHAVAVALRNRYRRSRLSDELREEVTPHNILMTGPTGVGKTEIARRLARLVNAPFVKVEATKYTEVGYVGRDVESMVRDLVEEAIRILKNDRVAAVQPEAERQANERLVRVLVPGPKRSQNRNPLNMLFNNNEPQEEPEVSGDIEEERRKIRQSLEAGFHEDTMLEVEVEDNSGATMMPGMGMEINLQDMMGGLLPKRTKVRKVKLSEARRIFTQEEAQKLIDMDECTQDGLRLAQEEGIIFIDEIDKIAGQHSSGPDVSREGVQRDILPIVEGSTVSTKYGPVKTDHMLFIGAGAFHVAKIEDLIPEMQGRFPVKVTLKSLSEEDFLSILTQPENALIKQYTALLAVEDVHVTFTQEALAAVAHCAFQINEYQQDIGARRLHTVMEQLMDDIAFHAGENTDQVEITVDGDYVNTRLETMMEQTDLGRYIL